MIAAGLFTIAFVLAATEHRLAALGAVALFCAAAWNQAIRHHGNRYPTSRSRKP